jgi:hypothetical protein
MIFARSNRSIWMLTIAALLAALPLTGGTVILVLGGRIWDALALGLLAVVAVAVVVRLAIRLRRWPAGRLAVFRDRLVLVSGRLELQAAWTEIRLTERLNVRLRSGRSFSFRPKTFGLEPVACRDLFLTLRDDSRTRDRLPVFDSVLDMTVGPLHTGELIRPQL